MAEPSFISAGGVRFAYLEEGQGPLVLLVHGFPDTFHTWDDVRPALANAGYRAVSVNTRGYWPTDVPSDERYDAETLGGDILALIDAFGAAPAIVVGHDWGASAAYSAATLGGPDKVRFLATVAIPHPGSLKPLPRLIWAGRHFFTFRFKSGERKAQANDFALIDELVQRWSPTWDLPPGATDAAKEAFRKPGCLSAALGYYRAQTLAPPPSHRKRVRVPSVVFSGSDDPGVLLVDYERSRSWYESDFDIVQMPGGHFMHREHPERFVEELLRALPAP